MQLLDSKELKQDVINYVNWCDEEDLVKIWELIRNKKLVLEGDSYHWFYSVEEKE